MKNSKTKAKVKKLDHDDPIVADNGPVEINFTKPPLEIVPGTKWARAYTKFEELEIRLDENQESPRPLKKISDLVFIYAKPGSTAAEATVTYSPTTHDTIFVSIASDKLKRKASDARHVLIPLKPNLRLRTVRGVAPNGQPIVIELFDGNKQPKHDTVKFRVVAVRE